MQHPARGTASAAMMAMVPESGSCFAVDVDKSGAYGYEYYSGDRVMGMQQQQQLADLSCVFHHGFPAAQSTGGDAGRNINHQSSEDNYNAAAGGVGTGMLAAAEMNRHGEDDDVDDDMMRMIGSVAGGASPSTSSGVIPAKANHWAPWHLMSPISKSRLSSGVSAAHLPAPTTIFDPNYNRFRMGGAASNNNYAYPSSSDNMSHAIIINSSSNSSAAADYFPAPAPEAATHTTDMMMRLLDFHAAAADAHVVTPNNNNDNNTVASSQSSKPAPTTSMMITMMMPPPAAPALSHLQAASSSSSDSITSSSAAHEQCAVAATGANSGAGDLSAFIHRTGKRRRFHICSTTSTQQQLACTAVCRNINNIIPTASSSLVGGTAHPQSQPQNNIEGDPYYVASAGDLECRLQRQLPAPASYREEFGHGSLVVHPPEEECSIMNAVHIPTPDQRSVPPASASVAAASIINAAADRLRIQRRSLHLEQFKQGTSSVPIIQFTTSNACVEDYHPQRHMNENVRKKKIKVEPHITNDQYYGNNIGRDIDMAKINVNDTNQNATSNYISENNTNIQTTIPNNFPMMHDNVGSTISLHLEKELRKLKSSKYNIDGCNGMDESKSKTSSTIVPGSSNTYNMKATWRRRSNKLSRNALGPALNTNGKPRAPQGSANDPQSIAARTRRERINARFKTLQDLVPNASKFDLATMLEKAIDYVKLLQLQLKILSDDELWKRTSIATVMRGGNGNMIDGINAETSAVPSTSTSIAVQFEGAAAVDGRHPN